VSWARRIPSERSLAGGANDGTAVRGGLAETPAFAGALVDHRDRRNLSPAAHPNPRATGLLPMNVEPSLETLINWYTPGIGTNAADCACSGTVIAPIPTAHPIASDVKFIHTSSHSTKTRKSPCRTATIASGSVPERSLEVNGVICPICRTDSVCACMSDWRHLDALNGCAGSVEVFVTPSHRWRFCS
jgi:hypothetical protein